MSTGTPRHLVLCTHAPEASRDLGLGKGDQEAPRATDKWLFQVNEKSSGSRPMFLCPRPLLELRDQDTYHLVTQSVCSLEVKGSS